MRSSLVLSFVLTGCASVVVLMPAEPIPPNGCQVRVYASKEEATKAGDIEELVMISGTSSGSLSHTVGTAVNKHKDKVCEYGAKAVYVQSQDAGTLGTASVTLVGFRFKNKN